jgi:hypothetical protein
LWRFSVPFTFTKWHSCGLRAHILPNQLATRIWIPGMTAIFSSRRSRSLSVLWWDERGEFALLHKMNSHRIRFIRETVLEVSQVHLDTTSTATSTPILPTLDSLHVLEGHGCLGHHVQQGYIIRGAFFKTFRIFLVYLLMNGR